MEELNTTNESILTAVAAASAALKCSKVKNFIRASYELDINPLKELRKKGLNLSFYSSLGTMEKEIFQPETLAGSPIDLIEDFFSIRIIVSNPSEDDKIIVFDDLLPLARKCYNELVARRKLSFCTWEDENKIIAKYYD